MRHGGVGLSSAALALFALALGGCGDEPRIFDDPGQPVERRVENVLSLMTLDEKIAALGTDPSVQRLGIRGSDHIEGLHGAALGGPGAWGGSSPTPTTQFPQAYGLGETWDPALIRRVARPGGAGGPLSFSKPRNTTARG